MDTRVRPPRLRVLSPALDCQDSDWCMIPASHGWTHSPADLEGSSLFTVGPVPAVMQPPLAPEPGGPGLTLTATTAHCTLGKQAHTLSHIVH